MAEVLSRCLWCGASDMIWIGRGSLGFDYECQNCGSTWRVTALKLQDKNLERTAAQQKR